MNTKNFILLILIFSVLLLTGCTLTTPWGPFELNPSNSTLDLIGTPTPHISSGTTPSPINPNPTSTPAIGTLPQVPQVVWMNMSSYGGFILEIDGVVTSSTYDKVGAVVSPGEMVRPDGNALFLSNGSTGTPRNIVVRLPYMMTNELWNWRKSVVDGSINRKNMALVLLDNSKMQVGRYLFTNAWPYGYQVTIEDGVLYETIYIAVENSEYEAS